jgi:translocation and assembly module TamB
MNFPANLKIISVRVLRIILKTGLLILILLILVIILIQTAFVQNIIRGKAETYLQKKLHTRVSIGNLYVGFPKTIVIKNIYLDDQQKDTLLSGGKLEVDVSLFKLLKHQVELSSIDVENFTAKVNRKLPDTVFNYQFILNAFNSPDAKPDTAVNKNPWKITLGSFNFNKIRLVYNDVVNGNDDDVYFSKFETDVASSDLDKMKFDISLIKVVGLRGKIYQQKPLIKTIQNIKVAAVEKSQQPQLFINLRKVFFNDVNVDYEDSVGQMFAAVVLDELNFIDAKIDMQRNVFDLNKIELNNTTAKINLGKQNVVADTANKNAQQQNAIRLTAANISLKNDNIQFDDDNKIKQEAGMDYSHLQLQQLNVQLKNLLYSADSIAGNIDHLDMKEKSGLVINNFHTQFLYASTQAYLKDLLIQTPGTEIKRSLIIHYTSLADIQKNIGKLQLDIDINNSKVQVKDILVFMPAMRTQPAFKNPSATFLLSGKITGSVADMDIKTFQLQGFSGTKINANGKIAGLPEMKNMKGNFTLSLSSNRNDILLIADGKMPAGFTIPQQLNINGNTAINNGALNAAIAMTSSSGNAKLNGTISQFNNIQNSAYTATLITDKLDVGTITQNQKNIGIVSAEFNVKGEKIDPKKMNATVKGIIHSAVVKQYNYKELQFDASLQNQQMQATAGIEDPNIHLLMHASGNIAGKYPSIKLDADIDSIKTKELHLTDDAILYYGKIRADFASTNPDHLLGKLLISKSLLVKDNRRVPVDTIEMISGDTSNGQYINFRSDIMNLQLQGQYKLTQLASVFQQAIQPYYKIIADDKTVHNDPYNFTIAAKVINKPLLKTLVPDLTKFDSVTMNGHFSDKDGWNAALDVPLVVYGDYRINKLHMQSATKDGAIAIQTSIQQFKSGASINLFHTEIDAGIKNNQINFSLGIKDSVLKDKYFVQGLFHQTQEKGYEFSLKPDKLLLNYKTWTVKNDNKIIINPTAINVKDFLLQREGQELSINSLTTENNSPVEVQFNQFKISTLTGFVQQDSTFANGVIQGKITLTNLLNQPVFNGNLVVHDLSLHKDTIGDVTIKVNNADQNTIAANIAIDGHGNNVKLNGNYYLKPVDGNSFAMNLDIEQLQLNALQAMAASMIKKASGTINGKFSVAGSTSAPVINGDLNFNKAVIVPTMLGSYFSFDNEKLNINKNGITLNAFTITDSLNNKLVIDGDVKTTDFSHYNFGLTVKAKNFQALNTTKVDNKLYYGKLFFNANLNIKGTELQPTVDGSLKIDDKTKLTVVMPQQDPGIEDRNGVIQFVNMRSPQRDSIFNHPQDSLNNSSILGMDISANISIDKGAEMNLIIDEGNGDFLRVKGEASLTGGIDRSGKTTLSGTYELEEGSYDLSFSLIHKQFSIAKGSTITWTGEPTNANLNINAIYVANAAPSDLVDDQLSASDATTRNTYLQKLPFQVYLKMTGELLKPSITFDVQLPEDKSYNVTKDIISTVEAKLDLLRQEPSEMNKQVLALLLLGRFVGEDPFASNSGGTSAESIARQSVSKILTSQLNQLASSLIKGVDINFDLQSTDDYTTGNLQNRTDLNVAVSKRLLNDRLTVSVGSNFELEGPQTSDQTDNIAGNIAVDYKLSKDGRYTLRAYRKNDYDDVLEGYVVETGVGFIITIDYNSFREIFMKKNKKKNKKNTAQPTTSATISKDTKSSDE